MSDFICKSYDNLTTKERENFFSFCKTTSLETTDPASVNMWNHFSVDAKNTIFYKLEKTAYFEEPNGKFFILFFNNNIIGCSGVYRSTFNYDIFIVGSRTWIKKEFRNLSLNKKYFFPIQKQWVKEKNGKIIALTFNNYNKNIISIFKRNRLGETNTRILGRLPGDLFYDNFNEITFSLNIHNTEQWACFEQLDTNFYFDWSSIKYHKS